MSFRLRNDKNPRRTLQFTSAAWYSILEVAEEFGWNPMGTVVPEWWYEPQPVWAGLSLDQPDYMPGSYTPGAERLVMLDDALNLADALDRIFMDWEPGNGYPIREFSPLGLHVPGSRLQAGIGAIVALIDFCQEGQFWIEKM